MRRRSVMALVAFLAISSCAVTTMQNKGTAPKNNNQQTTTVQQSTVVQQSTALVKQESAVVKDTTTEVLVDKEIKKEDVARVVKHGDHWHVFTKDGKEHITYVNPETQQGNAIELVSVVSLAQLKNMDVVSVSLHGDHWHVKTRDGKEYLTYENPSSILKNVVIGQYTGNHKTPLVTHDHHHKPVATNVTSTNDKLDVVRIAKHGDHYHVYTKDGQEFVVYSDPRALYPKAKYSEYQGSHSGNVVHDDHDDHNHHDNKQENSQPKPNDKAQSPLVNSVKVVSAQFLKNVKIAKVLKHGDHYHVYAKDGKEYLTYDKLDKVLPHVKIDEYKGSHDKDNKETPNKVASNKEEKSNQKTPPTKPSQSNEQLDVVRIAKHGDHYHVYTRDGQEFVVYSDPRALYPKAKYSEYQGNHSGNDDHDMHHHDDHEEHDHEGHHHEGDDHEEHDHEGHHHEGDDHEEHDHDGHDHNHKDTKQPSDEKPNNNGDKKDVGSSQTQATTKKDTTQSDTSKDGDNDKTVPTKPSQLNIVKVVSADFLKTVNIAKILKHGDHYHVYATDGKEYLSYDKLEKVFPHITIENYQGSHGTATPTKPQSPVLAVKHGDHWHLYADLEGKQEVGITKENPRVKYPSIKVEEHHHDDHDQDKDSGKDHHDHHDTDKNDGAQTGDTSKDDSTHTTDETTDHKDETEKRDEKHSDKQNDSNTSQETPVLARRHGDHWHLYADLEGKKELGVVHEDPRSHYPNIKVEEFSGTHGGENHRVAAPDFVLSENLKKQRENLAKQLKLSVDAIRVIIDENNKVVGFEYPHDDHYDFVNVNEETSENSDLTSEQKRELTAYIRKSYGLLLGTPVTFHKDFVVFAIPHPHQDYDAKRDYYSDELDPNYDAGHVHPYAVPLSTLSIPVTTGIPELDFENELIEAAKRRGVAPSEVKIKDHKYFVLPGKDHDHYLNILTGMDGYKAYFDNKLPDITPNFVEGDYAKEKVVEEVKRVLSEAKDKFKDGTVEFRRIARVLEAFEVKLNIPTTSTAGYIQALQAFENKYVKGIDDTVQETPESNEFTQIYTTLIEKLKTYDERTVSQYGINPQALVTQLQRYVVDKNAQGLKDVEVHFAAIDRAKLASSDLAPRLAYMDYFVRNLDSDRLSASLRLEVINKLNELYKISGLYRNPQKFREGLKSTALLKERVKAALATNTPAPDHNNWLPYPRGFYRKDVAAAVNSMRDFVIKNKEITAEEMAEGFGKKLDLFLPHPKKPRK